MTIEQLENSGDITLSIIDSASISIDEISKTIQLSKNSKGTTDVVFDRVDYKDTIHTIASELA